MKIYKNIKKEHLFIFLFLLIALIIFEYFNVLDYTGLSVKQQNSCYDQGYSCCSKDTGKGNSYFSLDNTCLNNEECYDYCESNLISAKATFIDSVNSYLEDIKNFFSKLFKKEAVGTFIGCPQGQNFLFSFDDSGHATINNDYDNGICSSNFEVETTQNNHPLIRLSDTTNAHVEKSDLNNYNNVIYIKSSQQPPQDFSCGISSTNCGQGAQCLFSISDDTNAHVGACDYFDKKICCGVNVVSCPNGIINLGEDCEGTNLNSKTCEILGFAGGGTLSCSDTCQFDTSQCIASNGICGNGQLESGEYCDDDHLNNGVNPNLNNKDCINYIANSVYIGGTLKCSNTCQFNPISCTPPQNLPTVTITSPATGSSSNVAIINVQGTAQDDVNVTNVELKLNTNAWTQEAISGYGANVTWNKSLTLNPGLNTIKARAKDNTNSYTPDGTQPSISIIYNVQDNQNPSIAVSQPTNNYVNSDTTINFAGSASDNIGVSKVQIKLNNGNWIDASINNPGSRSLSWIKLNFGPLNPGSNTLSAKAIDLSGRESSVVSRTVIYDDSAPAITINSPVSGNSYLSPVSLQVTTNKASDCRYSETNQGYDQMLAANQLTKNGNTHTKSVTLTAGQKILYISCKSQTSSIVSASFNVLASLPSVSILSPTSNQRFATQTITVSGDSYDDFGISKVQVKVADGAWQDATLGNQISPYGLVKRTWSKSVTLESGPNMIRAKSLDNANTPSTEDFVIGITYDTLAPTFTLTSVGGDITPPYITADSTPDVIFNTNENADCKYSLTDQGYSQMTLVCTGTQITHTCTLADVGNPGTKNVYISCKDSLGHQNTNIDNKDVSFEFAPNLREHLNPNGTPNPTGCSDNIDNDNDGVIDGLDKDCATGDKVTIDSIIVVDKKPYEDSQFKVQCKPLATQQIPLNRTIHCIYINLSETGTSRLCTFEKFSNNILNYNCEAGEVGIKDVSCNVDINKCNGDLNDPKKNKMNLTIQTTTPALCKKEIGEDKITIDEINLDDEEYEKDDKINPSITISNNGEDDLEITVEAYLYDINDKKDLISTNLTNTVSAGDSESYDLELITPAIKESRFKLYFKVYQKDEERDICLQEGKDIKIVSSIPEDFIAITNTKITKKLQEDQVITLKINNEYHDLEVLQVYTDKVKVEISSDPIEVVLDVAQTKEIDVNGDGINDLSITLDLIKDKKASLSFKLADGGTITPPPEAECTNGQTQECGTDIGICKKGTQTCINEQWTLCNDIKPTQETCNDNLDNDCNGKTDCSDDSCLNEPECKIEGGEDTDNDGLPDKWELKYFGNLRQGPDDDSDGDGFSNIDEYSKDTNPKDSSDFPKKDSNLIIIVTIVAVLGIAGFLVWKFTRKKPGTGINSNVSSGVNPALTNYIKSALQQGYNKQQIRSILLKKNWTSKDIEDAFKNI